MLNYILSPDLKNKQVSRFIDKMNTLVPLDKKLRKSMGRSKVGSLSRLTKLHMPLMRSRAPSQPPQSQRPLISRKVLQSVGPKSSLGLFRVNDKEIEDIVNQSNHTEDSLILELNDLLTARKQEKLNSIVQRKVIRFRANKQKNVGNEGSKNPLFAKQPLNKIPLMRVRKQVNE